MDGCWSMSRMSWSSTHWGSVNWSSVDWSCVDRSCMNWCFMDWSGMMNRSRANRSSVNGSSMDWCSVDRSTMDWRGTDRGGMMNWCSSVGDRCSMNNRLSVSNRCLMLNWHGVSNWCFVRNYMGSRSSMWYRSRLLNWCFMRCGGLRNLFLKRHNFFTIDMGDTGSLLWLCGLIEDSVFDSRLLFLRLFVFFTIWNEVKFLIVMVMLMMFIVIDLLIFHVVLLRVINWSVVCVGNSVGRAIIVDTPLVHDDGRIRVCNMILIVWVDRWSPLVGANRRVIADWSVMVMIDFMVVNNLMRMSHDWLMISFNIMNSIWCIIICSSIKCSVRLISSIVSTGMVCSCVISSSFIGGCML